MVKFFAMLVVLAHEELNIYALHESVIVYITKNLCINPALFIPPKNGLYLVNIFFKYLIVININLL